MKCLITGAAGFIGSHLAERLLQDGHQVIGIDDLSSGYRRNIPTGVYFLKHDITHIKYFSQILAGVDVVFNLAASKKNICLNDPVRDLWVNGLAQIELCQACIRHGVKRIVHFSTGSVIGEARERVTEDSPCRPVSFYGISKLAGENYMKYYGKELDITIIRPHHVYGSRQEDKDGLGGVIAIFKRRIAEGLPVEITGTGNQERLFTHVSALVDASVNAVELNKTGVYNIASSEKTTINELAKILGAEKINYIEEAVGDIHSFNLDNTKSKELGVEYISLKEGLLL